MSRYTVTIHQAGRTDPDAIIGYDPPLQTFFVQAFPHPETDDPALWLGTMPYAFPTLSALLHAIDRAGCEVDDTAIAAMLIETITPECDPLHYLQGW
jgi:hypothetical protein